MAAAAAAAAAAVVVAKAAGEEKRTRGYSLARFAAVLTKSSHAALRVLARFTRFRTRKVVCPQVTIRTIPAD